MSTVGDNGDSFGLFQVRRPFHCTEPVCEQFRDDAALNADYYGGILRSYYDGKQRWLNTVSGENGKPLPPRRPVGLGRRVVLGAVVERGRPRLRPRGQAAAEGPHVADAGLSARANLGPDGPGHRRARGARHRRLEGHRPRDRQGARGRGRPRGASPRATQETVEAAAQRDRRPGLRVRLRRPRRDPRAARRRRVRARPDRHLHRQHRRAAAEPGSARLHARAVGGGAPHARARADDDPGARCCRRWPSAAGAASSRSQSSAVHEPISALQLSNAHRPGMVVGFKVLAKPVRGQGRHAQHAPPGPHRDRPHHRHGRLPRGRRGGRPRPDPRRPPRRARGHGRRRGVPVLAAGRLHHRHLAASSTAA